MRVVTIEVPRTFVLRADKFIIIQCHKKKSCLSQKGKQPHVGRFFVSHQDGGISHSYLIQGLHAPPSCFYCNEINLSVDHLFYCPSLQNLRSIYGVPDSSPSALCNKSKKVSLRSTYYFPLLQLQFHITRGEGPRCSRIAR